MTGAPRSRSRPGPAAPIELPELPDEAAARRRREREARAEALHAAVRAGDHAAIVAQVTAGADLEDPVPLSRARYQRRTVTPLMAAAGSADGASLETVVLLIELGADPDRELEGRSALSYAAGGLGPHPGELDGRPVEVHPDDPTPGGGDRDRLAFFLGRGRLDEVSRREAALLAETIATGDPDRVGLLLAHGVLADVPIDQALAVVGRPGWRTVASFDTAPIVCAARGPSGAVVERLVAAGADPRIVDGLRRHPLFVVQHADAARALIAAGLDPQTPGRADTTALADAIGLGDRDRVAALLAAGADPNTVRDGRTLLMDAVSAIDRDPAIVRLLIEHGADPHAVTAGGWNALDYAVDVNGHGANQADHLRAVLGYLVSLDVELLGNNRYTSALEVQIIEEARAARRKARRDDRRERPRVRPSR